MNGTMVVTPAGLGLKRSFVTLVSTGSAGLASIIERFLDEGSHCYSCETPSPISGASS